MSLWAFVKSVLLCFSVRNRTLPLYDTTHKQHAGEVYLSRWGVLSLTEHTEFTELFGAQFRAHRTPPAYREHRGLTPSPSPNGEGSSMRGYPYWATQNWRICRGISVITPLSIRIGAGGEASEGCWVLDVGC